MLQEHDAIVSPEQLVAQEEGGDTESTSLVSLLCSLSHGSLGARIGERRAEHFLTIVRHRRDRVRRAKPELDRFAGLLPQGGRQAVDVDRLAAA